MVDYGRRPIKGSDRRVYQNHAMQSYHEPQ